MALTTAQKLRIKEGTVLYTINAPADFTQKLQPLPASVSIVDKPGVFHQLHWFINNQQQLVREVDSIISLLHPLILCWIYFPKGSSKLQTDLTRDKGWEPLTSRANLRFINLVSFDDTWSAFGFVLKNNDETKTTEARKTREIFDYIDPVKKTITLPPDLQEVLGTHVAQKAFFDTLSFTNKKEYVEWIVTAKRTETRASRISETIERLGKQWKNPRNL